MKLLVCVGFFLIFGVSGWKFGADAVDAPRVSVATGVGGLASVVVYSSVADAQIQFWWELLPDGKVSLDSRTYGAGSSNEPVVATAVLLGDAKMSSFEGNPSVQEVWHDMPGPGEKEEVQIVTLGRSSAVVGHPKHAWSSTVNGRTLARAPSVMLPYGDLETSSIQLAVPSVDSGLYTYINGPLDGNLESYSPQSVPSGEVKVEVGRDTLKYPTDEEGKFEEIPVGTSVGWGAVGWTAPTEKSAREMLFVTEDGPLAELPAATARFSRDGGIVRAQQHLLISGVLLGLAGAAFWEAVLATVQVRRRKIRGPAT